ncbi:hypothetical protein LB049_004523, partial [Vibrio vulnificus]|nr:hypothetical protein [Vibrio vulnificus]
ALSNIISIIVCVKEYISDFKYIPWSSFLDVWKKTLTFSAPLLIWSIFGWSRDSSLRWFIEAKLGTSDVAVFTAITSIAVIAPLALQSLVSAYVIPILYQNDEGKNRYELDRKFSYFIRYLYIFGLLVFFILLFYSDLVVELFTDEKYIIYSWALPWVFLSYYLFCCSMLNCTTLLVQYDTKSLLYPNLLSGVVAPLIFFIYADNYSFKFVIVSYVLSYFSYFLSATIIVFNSRKNQE